MDNALKNPLPGDDDFEEYYAEEAGPGKFLKFKRPLLILFFLAFVIGVFSLFVNQKKPIVAEKEIPQPSIVTPPESIEKTPLSFPVLEKPDPVKTIKPLPKIDNVDLAYKGDKEYLKLNRYEQSSRTVEKSVRTQKPNVRDTVIPGDKPLTLAGKGFDLKGLQAGRHVDFSHRLQKPLPKIDPVPEDHLDLQLTQAKSSKDLIFHPARQAWGEGSRQLIHQQGDRPTIKKPQALEGISETKLLLLEGRESFLILRPASESLDLLSGNEKINRKTYFRW